ncbi:Asp23/Gls24 family envelope stress response protein [Streptomyces sp. NPDC001068]|uniref:Asp23/Gls24 family envelope stress response protein n=1 Tax=Streptomyces sp. NPDC001068 TaxID=3364544 RepID=UPI0036A31C1E
MTTRTDPPEDARPRGGGDGDGDVEELLPCGRSLSRVWDDRERRTDDPHPATCPHCRRATGELERLESAVRGLREEAPDVSAYDAEPLTRRVMELVRLELRPGRPLPLGEPAEDLWIMETVAARALRAAAETVRGVRAGSCRVSAADGPAGGVVAVRLDIHAPAGAALRQVAEQVRQRVREAAERQLGMVTGPVDIRVTDLVGTPADGREGSTP